MIKHLDLPKQGHLSPPVLRWCASSILVPLQDSTSGSVPWLVMSKVINHCDIDIDTNVQ